MERFRMLKAKGKRLREEQEARDVRVDPVKLEDMNCSSQVPHPAKRACAGNVRVLKEEDPTPVDMSTHAPTKVASKLEPPAVKRSPVICVAFGNADLMSNATGGVDQEGQEVSAAPSVPRGASDAGNEEPSSEQHEGHQQSDIRDYAGLISVRQEKNYNEGLNIPFAAGDDKESSAGGNNLVQPTNDGNGSPVMPLPMHEDE